MSDSDDEVTKKKQKVNDDQSAGCSKMFNTCAQRLLYGTQPSDSNQSTQTTQEICDNIIDTNNDQGTSNSRQIVRVRVDNKAAKRNRLYRERHREEINQRRSEIRQRKKNSHQINTLSNIQNINEIEQITHATSNNQPSANSHTRRQRRYYERHAEEINKLKRDSRRKQNTPQSTPATAAERNRIYRERNRQKINERRRDSRRLQQNVQRVHTECNINNIDAIEQNTKATTNNQRNTHHFEETHNDRVQTTTAAFQTIEGQDSNSYSNFHLHKFAHKYFIDNFKNNQFGHACSICDRLWFEGDLKKPTSAHEDIINKITNIQDISTLKICATCKSALDKNRIPKLSVYNGFRYPEKPQHLPTLDFVTERLLSPRIPFMQIRRLRHVHEQFGIYGQIINVPVTVDTMVNSLPRNINDEHCVYVHIKKKKKHKRSFVHGLANNETIKLWLQHLLTTPVYQHYKITVNKSFFKQDIPHISQQNIDDFSENIDIEESVTAQQQTLMWNKEKFLRLDSGQHNIPQRLLFDEHVEELSFPSIYLGQFRKFKDGVTVTPFMLASSELRRQDRRGVDPYHLLFMAVKMMTLRVRDSLTIAFKHVGTDTNITKKQVQSAEYINNCVESNLAFLRSIPNSVWYWAEKKRNLFAIIRQIGKPTAFMTLSANEIGWPDLLKLLHSLARRREGSQEFIASELSFIEKSSLVNNDAVTCVIYFNKLVNVILTILQSKKFSPFGKYRVINYFKRIEFQHGGSPHAHILLWLDNAPDDILGKDQDQAIEMIDSLVSVSSAEASGNIKLNTHKHSFTCYKEITANSRQECRFDAPFMPCKFTVILTPMEKTDRNFKEYSKRYAEIRINLESNEYSSFDDYYESNNIRSDEEYKNIIRSGITRPRIFYKRHPSEKLHNTFNPFVFNVLKSNMDFQIITEEYSCAAYVVDYVNKTNRGISNLQRNIIAIMNEHPEFDIVEITRKMSVDMLNSVEMTSQEAAWYLLREPMSKSSVAVQYIDTCWPFERKRIKKSLKQISELHEDSTDIWKEDWHGKYQNRPNDLENVTLAQFVSKYTKNNSGVYVKQKQPRIIRYRNYDMALDYNEYRREMVTLHWPFRNEDTEILADMKFITIYDENENTILQKRKEFESNFDIKKTIDICRQLCRQDDQLNDDELEIEDVATRFPEPNPFQELYENPNAAVNVDLRTEQLVKEEDL